MALVPDLPPPVRWRVWQADDPVVEVEHDACFAESAVIRWGERFLPLGGTCEVRVQRADGKGGTRSLWVTARRAIEIRSGPPTS